MAESLKILTLADGFGDSQACPPWYPEFHKWPALLKLMCKNITVIDKSRYGAGNEYIITQLRHNYRSADIVLVQWAMPNRLDLMLSHSPDIHAAWHQIRTDDPIYANNVETINDTAWWLTSSSTQSWIQEYHERYITEHQHQARSIMWVELAENLLVNQCHGFMLSSQSDYLQQAQVNAESWIWHRPWQGLHEWRYHSEYRDLDLGYIQPIPLIHFDFIQKFVKPRFALDWRSDHELKTVESFLLKKYNQYRTYHDPNKKFNS